MPATATFIISNQYAEGQFAKEFGRLPLSFLPDGLHRLYERQIAVAKCAAERVYLLLPIDFEPSQLDLDIIAKTGTRILPISCTLGSGLALREGGKFVEADTESLSIQGHECHISNQHDFIPAQVRGAYFRERSSKLDARCFNSVRSNGASVIKSGQQSEKIRAEAQWYMNLPKLLKPFTPKLIATHIKHKPSYELEYLDLPLISELYAFALLPFSSWKGILHGCGEFLRLCQDIKPTEKEISSDFCERFYANVFLKKTSSRLQAYCGAAKIDMDKAWRVNGSNCGSLNKTLMALVSIIPKTRRGDLAFWHGDFHFGNIFYNYSSESIKTIDPRGLLPDGSVSSFGDGRYDIAKFHHSVIGMYDYLLTNRYQLEWHGDHDVSISFLIDPGLDIDAIQREFMSMTVGRYKCGDRAICAISSLLFLSMIPLHGGNPALQKAMLANGLRLAQSAISSESGHQQKTMKWRFELVPDSVRQSIG
jgi:hypothetical protein